MKGPKRREKLCLQIYQSSLVCCPVLGNAPQFLFTAACLICCYTMSLCTPENPCSECRRRVNYICISWCWPDNPLIHMPQSSASSCVYHHESRTLNGHKAWLGGFHFVSHTVASLEAKQGRKKKEKMSTNLQKLHSGLYMSWQKGCPKDFQFGFSRNTQLCNVHIDL